MDKETKEKIFGEMYEEAYRRLHSFLGRKQEDEDFVEDVIQETFLEAYNKIEFLADHPNRMGWLYLTAKHKAMKMRAKRKEICCLDDKVLNTIEDTKAGTVEYKEIELAETIKNSFSEKEYEMFRDYYARGYTHIEIADKYDVSESSVRMRMSRMKKKLRANIVMGWMVFAVCILNLL